MERLGEINATLRRALGNSLTIAFSAAVLATCLAIFAARAWASSLRSTASTPFITGSPCLSATCIRPCAPTRERARGL